MTIPFKHQYIQTAENAVRNQALQQALARLQNRFGKGTAIAYQDLPEGPDLRYKAHDIRMYAIHNLDILLSSLATKIRGNGGHVFFAPEGKDAVDYCVKLAKQHGVRMAVKGKSMVSEEIELNRVLRENGIETVETDLGEYIIQLADEHPSHIIAPAVHKTKEDIGHLFAQKLNIPYTDDPSQLTRAARKALREKFFAADMGISGCNLACAETGHITTVSNEGNIRMATTLPKIHMVFMGMERIVAQLNDFEIILRLLCRGAAAQNMATYVSHISGPALPEHTDGARELHLVILDNGRSKILADPDFREILCCVRCAACLNVCPVYGKIGGHAYGSAYPGPVGAIVTPLLAGINRAKDLCQGETLCGVCQNACPVNIDIPRMIRLLRLKLAEGDPQWNVRPDNRLEGWGYKMWASMMQNRRRYDLSMSIMRLIQHFLPQKNGMIQKLPPPLAGWTRYRNIKPLARRSFAERWQRTNPDKPC